jgi:hypothetical protein
VRRQWRLRIERSSGKRRTGQRGQRAAAGLLHDRGSVVRDRALTDLEVCGSGLVVLVTVAVGAYLVVASVDEAALILAKRSAIYLFSRTDATSLAAVAEALNTVRVQAVYEFPHVTCPALKMGPRN